MDIDINQFKRYIDKFYVGDDESVQISNAEKWEWFKNNIPFFHCPDKILEEIYYFRWWTYQKHIKHTPGGLIVTEFYPDVPWAGKYNSIVCSAPHHFYEGRWLKNNYLRDYALFWFRGGGSLRSYSCWLADAIYNYCSVNSDFSLCEDLLPDFVENYNGWECSNLHESGLFWSDDDRDGMEFSISGKGLRPTLNSYMYADAMAISHIAQLAGKPHIQTEFFEKAQLLKDRIQKLLWRAEDQFFETIPLDTKDNPIDIGIRQHVRELNGYIPWYFNIPDMGYESAWRYVMDEKGFLAPFGITSAEQNHEKFMLNFQHECLWNGPTWPFATAQTLTALSNLLCNFSQNIVDKSDYNILLRQYAQCHYRRKLNGEIVCWLDENLDPFTGEWLSRKILKGWCWPPEKGGCERGKDYNHSTFCDLIISGLVGLKPRADSYLQVQPLVGDWSYFSLCDIAYHGKKIDIIYDRNGNTYNAGTGFKVFVNDRIVYASDEITSTIINLSSTSPHL